MLAKVHFVILYEPPLTHKEPFTHLTWCFFFFGNHVLLLNFVICTLITSVTTRFINNTHISPLTHLKIRTLMCVSVLKKTSKLCILLFSNWGCSFSSFANKCTDISDDIEDIFFIIQVPEGSEKQFYFKILFLPNLKAAYHTVVIFSISNIVLKIFILNSLFYTFLSLFKLILYHRTPYIWFTKAIMIGHFKRASISLVSHVEDEFLYSNYLELDGTIPFFYYSLLIVSVCVKSY